MNVTKLSCTSLRSLRFAQIDPVFPSVRIPTPLLTVSLPFKFPQPTNLSSFNFDPIHLLRVPLVFNSGTSAWHPALTALLGSPSAQPSDGWTSRQRGFSYVQEGGICRYIFDPSAYRNSPRIGPNTDPMSTEMAHYFVAVRSHLGTPSW